RPVARSGALGGPGRGNVGRQDHLHRRDLGRAALHREGAGAAAGAAVGADLDARDVIRYSRRLDWGLGENALARALRQRREPFIDLTGSNPARAGLAPAVDLAPLADARSLRTEQEPGGLATAREAVSA